MPLLVSLVNLQKLTLWAWRGARQHADIGAGAEHARLARAQQNDLHLRMLEAQALDRVGELDIDAEVVGVELELVAFEQRALLVDVHQQRRDLAVDLELPMAIFRRIGLEIDPALAVAQFALCIGHRVSSRHRRPAAPMCRASVARRDHRLRGDHATAGWRTRRSRASVACGRFAVWRMPRVRQQRDLDRAIALLPAPPRSAAPCRIDRSRPARSGSAPGYGRARRVRSHLRNSGSSQGPHQL